MGLTIHYGLKASTCDPQAAAGLVKQLRAAAARLNFTSCSKIITWRSGNDPAVAGLFHHFIEHTDRAGQSHMLMVPPLDFTLFVVRRPGAEQAAFGLGRYAPTVSQPGEGLFNIPTGLDTYCWRGFCKTQYAAMTQNGGFANCFAMHDGIVRVLDAARELGIAVDVHDEGHYWETRDRGRLEAEVEKMNRLVAAFVGKVKDATRPGAVQAPITEDPAFEHWEAQGQGLLEPLDPDPSDN